MQYRNIDQPIIFLKSDELYCLIPLIDKSYKTMKDNIDINASTIIEGKETIEEVSKRIYEKVLRVASGEKTKAEVLGHRELAIYWAWPIP